MLRFALTGDGEGAVAAAAEVSGNQDGGFILAAGGGVGARGKLVFAAGTSHGRRDSGRGVETGFAILQLCADFGGSGYAVATASFGLRLCLSGERLMMLRQ